MPHAPISESADPRSLATARSQTYAEAEADPLGFWAKEAAALSWSKSWDKALDWQPPVARWFPGGELNASVNCLDRHLPSRAHKTAYTWIGEDGSERTLSYQDVYDDVVRLAGALRQLGVRRGDRVTLYMPMVPELPIAMLACARIGAAHNVVFAGFSPAALAQRMEDSGSKVLITADGYLRRGKVIAQKERADEALAALSEDQVDVCVVVRRMNQEVPWTEGRDVDYATLLKDAPVAEPVAMESNELLFMMYTSGTTGKPKGVMHGTGGYLTGASSTTRWVFDLQEDDVYWCMADIGWITGHTYIVYGPLLHGASSILYEGAPDWPDASRPWRIIQDHGVTVLYTAPTVIRAFMYAGTRWLEGFDCSSLRLLGSVGEPINPAAWQWYHDNVGGGRCPIVDTWWQTETGMIAISPIPGVSDLKPGSALRPLPGLSAAIFDDEGKPCGPGEDGNLVLTRPWPAMMLGLWNNPERYREAYWTRWGPEVYDTGDAAHVDADGDFWIAGRLDDVMNVAGHRLGTAELESALVAHAAVAEAAVVAKPDAIKGEVPIAFVILCEGAKAQGMEAALTQRVRHEIGPIATPARVVLVEGLPKTRSGKIMRRLLKQIVKGEPLGDVTTLRNPDIATAIETTWKSGSE